MQGPFKQSKPSGASHINPPRSCAGGSHNVEEVMLEVKLEETSHSNIRVRRNMLDQEEDGW